MKKIYLLSSTLLFSLAAVAQTPEIGKANPIAAKPFAHVIPTDRTFVCGDTAGWQNFTDFTPEFAAISGGAVIYGYTGGGYIYGNNVSTNVLRICGQGYQNLNLDPLSISGVVLWFGGKESDLGSSGTSKVVITAFDVIANRSRNTNGSGTFNSTVNNWPGPATTAKCSADLLFSDVDTLAFNYVPFLTPANFTGDFAVVMDVTSLAAGDTVGLVSDSQNDAQNLDYTWHKIGTNWYVTDQLFSNPGSPDFGSGGLDNDIAMWPVVCDPVSGVSEFYNGMKLTTFPNPAVNSTVIEYTLEENSKNVSIVVFDLTGRKLINNVYEEQNAGTYKVTLATENLAAGSYLYQLNANGHRFTKQFVVSK